MWRKGLAALALSAGILLALPAFATPEAAPVYVVPVTGVISPVTYDLIHDEIAAAAEAKAQLLVLAIDTPGGLYDATQQIAQDILDSPVPVAAYVSPAGAHAASAGTYILYASHIAAMAPSTRLGAATPIQMDASEKEGSLSVLERKMISDASAFIRGLAERNRRNADWAQKAVRDADSLTASEALAQKVVEYQATDAADLARQLDGKRVTLASGKTVTLHTQDAAIITRDPGLRRSFLAVITHPNIALLLMTLGTYGIIYEFAAPGVFFPGVIGAIALLLGLYAMNVLSVSFAGLGLLLLGIGLMTAEAFVPSFGALGLGGAAAFAGGALMLLKTDVTGFGIDPWLIATLGALGVAFLSVSLGMTVKSLRQPKVTGQEELLSAVATVTRWQDGRGEVRVTGEIWQARTDAPYILQPGDRVRIARLDGLVLIVEPLAPVS